MTNIIDVGYSRTLWKTRPSRTVRGCRNPWWLIEDLNNYLTQAMSCSKFTAEWRQARLYARLYSSWLYSKGQIPPARLCCTSSTIRRITGFWFIFDFLSNLSVFFDSLAPPSVRFVSEQDYCKSRPNQPITLKLGVIIIWLDY